MLHVVEIFQRLEQLEHGRDRGADEYGTRRCALRHFRRGRREAALCERRAHRLEIGRCGQHVEGAVGIRDHVFGTGIERHVHQTVLIEAGREAQQADLMKQICDRPVGSQMTPVAREGVAHCCDGAVAVVGEAIDHHRRAARAVALVARGVDGLVLATRGALHRALDRVARHARRARFFHCEAQAGIHRNIAAADTRRRRNFTQQLGENSGATLVLRALAMLDIGPFTVSRHANGMITRIAPPPAPKARAVDTVLRCPPALALSIDRTRQVLRDAGARSDTIARGLEAAEIVGALGNDEALALATLTFCAFQGGNTAPPLATLVGARAAQLARALAPLGDLGLPRNWQPTSGLDARQAETLRKMLLAVVSDPRLVLARLAIALVQLRAAREAPPDERTRLAIETREIFAPLANRLGVWQLKWELEDLAFRLLEPAEYKRIAGALNEKRGARELYIDDLCRELRAELAAVGIAAEVHGRPKHIFSIHRKMQRKQLDFERIFDVRAVRIVCADVPGCYAALGVVHGRWPYIPGEFDDYIATPKGNDYRSIHTAVIGPGGKAVEVQIRTQAMHAEAELGVAAHWRYKEGGVRDAGYERKVEAVRELLTPGGARRGDGDFIDRVQAGLFTDRVYALTPKGEVVELPEHATPLDFAYHLHTDLGHRCRGAKVNGRIVPLTHQLANGEVVEIITGRALAPSRDWMAPEQGYLASARSRSRVRAWFRRLGEADNRVAGRTSVEREIGRVAGGPEQLAALVQELKAPDADTLYRLVGEGEITATQLTQAITRLLAPAVPRVPARPRPVATGPGRSPVSIEGVGDLPITLARCCAPVRPQAIVGYVTVGRGVTVHRANCAGLRRMRIARPERVLECQWIETHAGTQTIEITVVGLDRRALVRDLTDVIASEHLRLDSLSTSTQRAEGTATTVLRVDIRDLTDLARVTQRLGKVPNVLSTRRTR